MTSLIPTEDLQGAHEPYLKTKLGPKTRCADCSHEQKEHHLRPEGHWQDGEWLYYCITSHCTAAIRGSGPDWAFSDCACLHFRATSEAVPEFTKPAVDDYTCCAACGHWRSRHCTKRKLKPGESPTDANWKGLLDESNRPIPCSHTPKEGCAPYACSSTACATVLGEGEDACYCECTKFVSPYLKKKVATLRHVKARGAKSMTLIPLEDLVRANQRYLHEQEQTAPKMKTKAEILVEIVREDNTCTVAELAEAAERSPSWVRRHLKAAGITLANPRKISTTETLRGTSEITADLTL